MLKQFKTTLAILALVGSAQNVSAADQTGELIDQATYSLLATFRVKPDQVDRFVDAMKVNTVEWTCHAFVPPQVLF